MSLIDYVNTFYPEFFTANRSLFTGNEIYAATSSAPPVVANQFTVLSWQGVEIENETLSVNGGLTIHQRVRSELEAGDDDVIIYDHGSGEVADFVTLKRRMESSSRVFTTARVRERPSPVRE